MLVLASRSPQRADILTALGVAFTLAATDFAEHTSGDDACALASANAIGKARSGVAVARPSPGDVVLGVDTVVTHGGVIYGKPADEACARATLAALSGVTHTVVSAVALVAVGADAPETVATASTQVTFRALDARTIDWYLARGEWRGRAGGYAIQAAGAALAESIDGELSNVVGLPVSTLLRLHPALLA